MKQRIIRYIFIIISVILITSLFGWAMYRVQNKSKTIFFAPYISTTHSCYTHTSDCQAELVDTPFSYNIIGDDGKMNLNGSAITGKNGFFELTLPPHNEYEISVFSILNSLFYNANTSFSSYPDAANCITTLQLIN